MKKIDYENEVKQKKSKAEQLINISIFNDSVSKKKEFLKRMENYNVDEIKNKYNPSAISSLNDINKKGRNQNGESNRNEFNIKTSRNKKKLFINENFFYNNQNLSLSPNDFYKFSKIGNDSKNLLNSNIDINYIQNFSDEKMEFDIKKKIRKVSFENDTKFSEGNSAISEDSIHFDLYETSPKIQENYENLNYVENKRKENKNILLKNYLNSEKKLDEKNKLFDNLFLGENFNKLKPEKILLNKKNGNNRIVKNTENEKNNSFSINNIENLKRKSFDSYDRIDPIIDDYDTKGSKRNKLHKYLINLSDTSSSSEIKCIYDKEKIIENNNSLKFLNKKNNNDDYFETRNEKHCSLKNKPIPKNDNNKKTLISRYETMDDDIPILKKKNHLHFDLKTENHIKINNKNLKNNGIFDFLESYKINNNLNEILLNDLIPKKKNYFENNKNEKVSSHHFLLDINKSNNDFEFKKINKNLHNNENNNSNEGGLNLFANSWPRKNIENSLDKNFLNDEFNIKLLGTKEKSKSKQFIEYIDLNDDGIKTLEKEINNDKIENEFFQKNRNSSKKTNEDSKNVFFLKDLIKNRENFSNRGPINENLLKLDFIPFKNEKIFDKNKNHNFSSIKKNNNKINSKRYYQTQNSLEFLKTNKIEFEEHVKDFNTYEYLETNKSFEGKLIFADDYIESKRKLNTSSNYFIKEDMNPSNKYFNNAINIENNGINNNFFDLNVENREEKFDKVDEELLKKYRNVSLIIGSNRKNKIKRIDEKKSIKINQNNYENENFYSKLNVDIHLKKKCLRCNSYNHTNDICQEKIKTYCKNCNNLNHEERDCLIDIPSINFENIENKNIFKDEICVFCGKIGHAICPMEFKVFDEESFRNACRMNLDESDSSSEEINQIIKRELEYNVSDKNSKI